MHRITRKESVSATTEKAGEDVTQIAAYRDQSEPGEIRTEFTRTPSGFYGAVYIRSFARFKSGPHAELIDAHQAVKEYVAWHSEIAAAAKRKWPNELKTLAAEREAYKGPRKPYAKPKLTRWVRDDSSDTAPFLPWEDPSCVGCRIAAHLRIELGRDDAGGCADHEQPEVR